MNRPLVSTATVRQRGQLTIPDKIREAVSWLGEHNIVSVSATKNQVIITPYAKPMNDKPDWSEIRRLLRLASSFKGTKPLKKPLSQFIIEDRERH